MQDVFHFPKFQHQLSHLTRYISLCRAVSLISRILHMICHLPIDTIRIHLFYLIYILLHISYRLSMCIFLDLPCYYPPSYPVCVIERERNAATITKKGKKISQFKARLEDKKENKKRNKCFEA